MKIKLYVKLTGFLGLIFFTSFPPLFSDAPTEKEKIIKVVNQFFTVLESRDAELAKRIVLPEGCTFSIRETDKKMVIKSSSFQKFLDSLPNPKAKYKEVMENPQVLLHKEISVLWAKYKFYINSAFSHCGVDAFSLMKTSEGWRIASIIYTVEKIGCD
jgi:hypothetical protein